MNARCRHLPHGFFESQLKGTVIVLCPALWCAHRHSLTVLCCAEYFGQFGSVSKVRVSRSKRSTASKGYAFLKFQHAEVARIACEAMNGYMMFGHTLKCSLVPVDQQHPALFKAAGRTMKKKPWLQMEADRHNMQRTPEAQQKRFARLAARSKRRSSKIREMGIDYDGPEMVVAMPRKQLLG
jgi:nucleolar protein 15